MNRRQLLSLLGISPALLAGARADAAPTKSQSDSGDSGSEQKFVALSPKGTPPPVMRYSMTPTLSTLDGKTIYLVDTGFFGADLLLNRSRTGIQRNMPSVKTVFARRPVPTPRRPEALGGNQGRRQRLHHGHRSLSGLHTSDRESLRNDAKDGRPHRPDDHRSLCGPGEICRCGARHADASHRIYTASRLGQDAFRNCTPWSMVPIR